MDEAKENVNLHSLCGRKVLVTGAGRGIGRAVAIEFARAGCNIACVSRTQEEIDDVVSYVRSTTSAKAKAFPFDITRISEIPRLIEQVEQWMGGPIEILINNGGIARIEALECQIDMDHWQKVMTTNLTAPVALINQVLPNMLTRQYGTIISIGSRNAIYNIPFTSSYSVSKTGLLRFHHILEAETLGQGICNYYVQPGNIDTKILDVSNAIDANAMNHDGVIRAINILRGCPRNPVERVAEACAKLACGGHTVLSGSYVDLDQDTWGQIKSDNGSVSPIAEGGGLALEASNLPFK
ncbi:NAD(P)-binding protein [Penicillium cosmopolitanum]|uniref:NAD(P)-binding protein n=1 Tax=Penicillium cosmopolitanum TaxID=1131564 RepID=A0A9W9VRC3_9EURO|nr:NAD(P)-binding protein [Penicillium cosmopolitanum]KAJ5387760.1 NAD(P)-binding protein [Penicillium cosmopolitanum]